MAIHELLPVGELSQGDIHPFELDGHHVLLVGSENGPAIINRICPHAGGDLANGKVVGNRIRCPTHSYLFDLKTAITVSSFPFEKHESPAMRMLRCNSELAPNNANTALSSATVQQRTGRSAGTDSARY